MFRLSGDTRAWTTYFKGEGATDAGGPYREVVAELCSELQSPCVPLFQLCPNGRDGVGDNRDKWVPRPSAAARPLHLSMLEFVGKLMGLAIRTKLLLGLDLPSIVWKALVNAPVTEEDVRAVNRLALKAVDDMRAAEKQARGLHACGVACSY